MEQNNFEKNVQQKLEELKIPPSDAVWINVEKKIAKKKKDRRMIFMLFFLILFLLSGGYWLFNSTEHNSHLQRHQLSNVEEKDNNSILPDSKQTNNTDSSSAHTAISSGVIPGKSGLSNVLEEKIKVHSIITQNKEAGNVINKKQKNTSAKIDFKENDGIISSSGNEKENGKKSISIEKQNETVDRNNLSEMKSGINVAKEKDSNSDSGIIAENKISTNTILKNKEEKLIANKDSSVKKPSKSSQKHKWAFGVTLSGGKSFLSNGLFSINKSNNDYYASMPNSGIGTSNPGNVSPSSLPVKTINSTAFIGGVFVEKDISEKTKISLGINYKYFSTISKTGSRINSAQFSFNSTTYTNTYRNNFNFLEIPVSLKFRLTNNKSLPVYWVAGINISQLISSNALQFKGDPGIYYNDNSLFNKTQLGFSTGFSATLFSKQKYPVTIGPYFYYDASRLANEGLYNEKHFNFIGISLEILFNKK